LSISGFTGITTDPFADKPLNGMKFTTKDRDNDNNSGNCAAGGTGSKAGGWWYNSCTYICPNHQYNYISSIYLNMKWHPLPFIEMKIKPNNC